MRVLYQIEIKDMTVLEVDKIENVGSYVLIDNKLYKTATVYDLPNHIAIYGKGEFIDKIVTSHSMELKP